MNVLHKGEILKLYGKKSTNDTHLIYLGDKCIDVINASSVTFGYNDEDDAMISTNDKESYLFMDGNLICTNSLSPGYRSYMIEIDGTQYHMKNKEKDGIYFMQFAIAHNTYTFSMNVSGQIHKKHILGNNKKSYNFVAANILTLINRLSSNIQPEDGELVVTCVTDDKERKSFKYQTKNIHKNTKIINFRNYTSGLLEYENMTLFEIFVNLIDDIDYKCTRNTLLEIYEKLYFMCKYLGDYAFLRITYTCIYHKIFEECYYNPYNHLIVLCR